MSDTAQNSLSDYTAGTTTEPFAKTVQCPLETSQRKTERVRECIDEWQAILSWAGDILPSFSEQEWNRNNPQLYHAFNREFDDIELRKQTAQRALYKAVEAFDAWASNGKPGERPRFDGTGDYIGFSNQGYSLEENDTGYGLKVKLQPYKPEWFHIPSTPYHDRGLQPVIERNRSLGSCELILTDEGKLSVNLVVKEDIEVYKPGDVPITVGVDFGENVIYAAAAVTHGDVEDVSMESGREFRHYREQLKRKRKRRAQKDDLRGVRKCRGDIERYTDQVTNTASKEIIEFALDHSPCVIQLEDMGDYRETAEDPIHDWPRGELLTQITYKATEAGIPVTTVDPAYTSVTCRKCGQTTPEYRNGTDFHCRRCGYRVHADVNAAINIAKK